MEHVVFFHPYSSHLTIPLFTLLMQGELDMTHMKVVLAAKLSKISCDYPLFTDAGWTRPDPHEGGAGRQDV
jgi:hypothetical protein